MTPCGVISTDVYEAAAKASKVFRPLTRLLLALEKTPLIEAAFADRALSISDLTMSTALPCGMNHDSSTSGSPARSGLTVWVDGFSASVTSCLKLTNPLGARKVLVTSTRPE